MAPTTPTTSRRERLLTILPPRLHPTPYRLATHPHDLRHLDLRATLADQPHRTPTQLLLSRSWQPSRIPIHTPNTTTNDRYLLRPISMVLSLRR